MDEPLQQFTKRPKSRVQRHSPDRLLRQKLVLHGGVTVSAEKHRGRVMIRVEVPDHTQSGVIHHCGGAECNPLAKLGDVGNRDVFGIS